jgi:prepilin-type N-terminal cleavage/methylation domain-containing protein
MKASPSRLRNHAFTLIELLTVIAILLVLMGLLFTAITTARDAARRTQASNDVRAIVAAATNFYTDYGSYPLPASYKMPEDFVSSPANQAEVINILRNNEPGPAFMNTRRIGYLEARMVKNPASPSGGVSPLTNMFYDPWGKPYFIVLDATYDGEITGAAKPAYTVFASVRFTFAVASYSYGKDGQPGKGGNRVLAGSDDIVSWQ